MARLTKSNLRNKYNPYKSPIKQNSSNNTQSSSPSSANSTFCSTQDSSILSLSPSNFMKPKSSPLVGSNRRKILQLDLEIRKAELKRDTILKAIKYNKSGEFDKINNLINKWQNIARMASNYLLNQYQIKISAQGGYKEWKSRLRQTNMMNNSSESQRALENLEYYMETPEYSYLSKLEKNEIKKRYDELEAIIEKESMIDNDDDNDDNDEFTMSEMYKYLKIDYNLVYGDENEKNTEK